MERDAGRISRRRFLGALGLGVAAAGVTAPLLETRRVTVTRHVLGAADPASAVPPLRVVQLADLHLGELDGHAERVAEAVTELRPRVVVFTGDSVTGWTPPGCWKGSCGSCRPWTPRSRPSATGSTCRPSSRRRCAARTAGTACGCW